MKDREQRTGEAIDSMLREFPGQIPPADDATLDNVIRRAEHPVRTVHPVRLVALCLSMVMLVTLVYHMGAITAAIEDLVESYRIRNMAVTKIERSLLEKYLARNHTYKQSNREKVDPDSMEYQIWYTDTDEPGYVYFFHYKGYNKLLVLDAGIDFEAASAYLRENDGITVPAAVGEEETRELLQRLLENPTEDVKYAALKADYPDCLLPSAPSCTQIFTQHSPVLDSYNVTYFTDNDIWLSLTVADAESEIGSTLCRNIPVAEDAVLWEIGGRNVIVTGGYALFTDEKYTYILYDNTGSKENMRAFLESMH